MILSYAEDGVILRQSHANLLICSLTGDSSGGCEQSENLSCGGETQPVPRSSTEFLGGGQT